jgi:hypothetical protein
MIRLLLLRPLEQLRRVWEAIRRIVVARINGVFERLGETAKVRPIGAA